MNELIIKTKAGAVSVWKKIGDTEKWLFTFDTQLYSSPNYKQLIDVILIRLLSELIEVSKSEG